MFLNTKNIQTRRLSKKLDTKKLGSLKIVKVISPWIYKLELPATVKIHLVQHVSLLTLDPEDPLPGQYNLPPEPVFVDRQEEWLVEDV